MFKINLYKCYIERWQGQNLCWVVARSLRMGQHVKTSWNCLVDEITRALLSNWWIGSLLGVYGWLVIPRQYWGHRVPTWANQPNSCLNSHGLSRLNLHSWILTRCVRKNCHAPKLLHSRRSESRCLENEQEVFRGFDRFYNFKTS